MTLMNIDFGRSPSSRGAAILSALLILAGCDGLFDVENPTNLLDEDLTVPQLENTLSTTAEGNLAEVLSRAVRYGDLLGDSYWHPNIQDFGLNIDRGYRDRDNVVVEEIYTDLAAARWIADDMVRRLEDLVADPTKHLGVANSHFWGAVARMTLASYYREVTYDAQAPIAPAQAITDAVEGFRQAAQIAGAAGDVNLQAAALGGVARAYRSLYYEGKIYGGSANPAHFQQAEQAAREALALRNNFLVNMRYAQPGPGNSMGARDRERMTPWYAFRRDPVGGELDPRIRHEKPDTTPQGQVMIWHLKFPNTSTPFPVSRAAEAELIVAEARYVAGDMDGAVEFINRVRARWSLPPFGILEPAAVWEQLMYERDTELWLEGRKWEDHRYYQIVPVLWDEVNKLEGTAKRWPISVQERANNPNYPKG